MRNMTLERIAEICNGTYIGDEESKKLVIEGIVIDSRLVKENYLFIAIRGEKVDGHSFIPAVFEKGAGAVLSEELLENPAGAYIQVASCQEAIKKLAYFYRRQFDIPVVGITGSVGKTSTKEMIASVLGQKYQVLKTEGNYNNWLGLSLTIFGIRDNHEVAVLEMGISEFGEMHVLAELAKPDVCVITNIGLCHLENLKSRDGILAAKTECFEHMAEGGIAVLNGDDDKLSGIPVVNGNMPVFYGLQEAIQEGCKAAKAVYTTATESMGLEGTKVCIHIGQENFEAVVPIPGEHNVSNALAATCVGRHLGLNISEIKAGIESAGTIKGRNNMLHVKDMIIIDDCYNANPVSMKASIDVLSQASGRKIAVLGDMGELGDREKELHYGVGEYLAGKTVDVLFTAGTLAEEIVKGVQAKNGACEIHSYHTRAEMTDKLKDFVKKGDTILVKASHFMEFSEVVKVLSSI